MLIKDNVKGLQHIGIPTGDIEKTIAFYTSLGFETAWRTKASAAGKQVAFLRLGSVTIETYQSTEAAMRNGAVDHVALDVKDIDAAFAEAQRGGYKLLHTEVQSLPFWEHGVRFFTIEGPNHEKVEFGQIL